MYKNRINTKLYSALLPLLATYILQLPTPLARNPYIIPSGPLTLSNKQNYSALLPLLATYILHPTPWPQIPTIPTSYPLDPELSALADLLSNSPKPIPHGIKCHWVYLMVPVNLNRKLWKCGMWQGGNSPRVISNPDSYLDTSPRSVPILFRNQILTHTTTLWSCLVDCVYCGIVCLCLLLITLFLYSPLPLSPQELLYFLAGHHCK